MLEFTAIRLNGIQKNASDLQTKPESNIRVVLVFPWSLDSLSHLYVLQFIVLLLGAVFAHNFQSKCCYIIIIYTVIKRGLESNY
jgi:hypothetical protein